MDLNITKKNSLFALFNKPYRLIEYIYCVFVRFWFAVATTWKKRYVYQVRQANRCIHLFIIFFCTIRR